MLAPPPLPVPPPVLDAPLKNTKIWDLEHHPHEDFQNTPSVINWESEGNIWPSHSQPLPIPVPAPIPFPVPTPLNVPVYSSPAKEPNSARLKDGPVIIDSDQFTSHKDIDSPGTLRRTMEKLADLKRALSEKDLVDKDDLDLEAPKESEIVSVS